MGAGARTLSGRAAAVVLVVLPLAGAAVAAATHASNRANRFAAEATLLVTAEGTGPERRESLAARTELLAAVLRAPSTAASAAAAVREPAPVDRVARRVTVAAAGDVGMIRVRAAAPTALRAIVLANAVAAEGVRLARSAILRSAGQSVEVVGDFEEPVTGWLAHAPRFTLAPERIELTRSDPFSGQVALRSVCPPEPGCGPWVRLERPFAAGTRIVATGYARSPAQDTRVKMVLGSSGEDVRTGPAVRLRRDWQRLTVSWTPRRDATSADLGFQIADPRRTTIDVDAVLMPFPDSAPDEVPVPASLDPDEERRVLDTGRYVTVSLARVVGEQRDAPIGWALLGLAAGLLVALASIAAGVAARRRGTQDQSG